ncbi:MerR family transcriptional regulator [Schaalia hyovaginalis]|uniref:Excisionase family DNA binding protein n=1 Tax=Schaalia hyovaginalis TaxID=29316 RepID=A0A923E8G0_9ACTO|nr:helix-turn-helix domain-containing protein [Schaalia hyovaginalis]MBB6335461.1 excisionase family DNA binding protein [Schaalia hyovaginalis]
MTIQNMQSNVRIDARQAGEILGVTAYTVRRWAKAGELPCLRYPSGRLYFRRADIEALLTPVTAAAPTSHDAPTSPSVTEVSDLVTAV